MRRRVMIRRTFPQNPRMGGKSHRYHLLKNTGQKGLGGD